MPCARAGSTPSAMLMPNSAAPVPDRLLGARFGRLDDLEVDARRRGTSPVCLRGVDAEVVRVRRPVQHQRGVRRLPPCVASPACDVVVAATRGRERRYGRRDRNERDDEYGSAPSCGAFLTVPPANGWRQSTVSRDERADRPRRRGAARRVRRRRPPRGHDRCGTTREAWVITSPSPSDAPIHSPITAPIDRVRCGDLASPRRTTAAPTGTCTSRRHCAAAGAEAADEVDALGVGVDETVDACSPRSGRTRRARRPRSSAAVRTRATR